MGDNKKVLVLDLDETLVHCFTGNECDFQLKIPISQGNGESIEVSKFKVNLKAKLNIRPYANAFLEKMSQKFEIIIFTA